eukprot:Em0003g282a
MASVPLKGKGYDFYSSPQLNVGRRLNLVHVAQSVQTDVERPSRGARGGVEFIQKPQMIDEYNKHMGGVDLSDQLVLYYGYSHRQIKWWNVNKQQLTQMEFRIAVAKGLLEGHTRQQAQHYTIAPQLPTRLTEHPENPQRYSIRSQGTNPVTMKNYGSDPMGSSTQRSSFELSVDDKPFDGLTFVKEANYTEFTKRLNEIGQYSLSDILDFSGSSKTDEEEVQAAFGIANLFHDINTRAVLDNKAKQVTVEWNFEALRFIIMYTVLEKENVVTAIENVLKKQREQMNGLFRMKHNPSKLITLSENELDKFKRNVVQLLAETWESEKTKFSSFIKDEGNLKLYLESCSFVNWEVDSTTIEQYNSSISLVFKLSNTLDGSSLFVKSFSQTNMLSHLAIIEHHLTKYHVQRSLCSSYFVQVSSGAYSTAFHVFRGLHHITRETAKECCIDFLQSVKAAVDELHSHDMVHLDIHLPNICLRNTPDGKYEAVLIDLERCERSIMSTLQEQIYDSCMYNGSYTLEQLDYLQVFWMAFWILLSPDKVDYHQMHEINFGQEYEDILNFIKVFNSEIWNDKEKLWKEFMEKIKIMVSSEPLELRCSCC